MGSCCTGSRRILIDAGVGDTGSDTFRGGRPVDVTARVKLQHLKTSQMSPSLTSIGTMSGEPSAGSSATFCNANWWCSQSDWDYFVEPKRTPAAAERLLCIREHFSFVREQITPDLLVIPAPGQHAGQRVV